MSESAETPAVLVTGASSGIGLECVRCLLADHGVNVVALSRHGSAALDELANHPQGSLVIDHADVSKDDENKEAIENALRFGSRLDAIVLCAGVLEPIARVSNLDMMSARVSLDVNIFGNLSLIKHALPYLRATNGRIIALSSGAAEGKTAAWSVYSASKAALNSMIRTVANEEPTITAIALRPGKVATAMQAHIRAAGQEMLPEEHNIYVKAHEQDKLILPSVPGSILANLALQAKHDLSGQYLEWNCDAIHPYRH